MSPEPPSAASADGSPPLFRRDVPLVIAHRGGVAEAPENSWEAVAATLDAGVRVLETDVRVTADGEVVLAHDETLERRFGDSRGVAQVTWDELSGWRDVEGGRPLRLVDALAADPEIVLNIDAKSDDVVGPLAALVAGDAARVCLTSFSSARLARLRDLLGGAVATGMGLGEVARLRLAPRGFPALRRVRDRPIAVQVPVRFRGVPIVTPSFVARAHAEGLVVHVWVVNASDEMQRLLELGVDGIVTDHPTRAVGVFRRLGLDPAGR